MGYGFNTAKLGSFTTKSSGVGGFIDYSIGGTVASGLVLAFGHHTLAVFSPDTTIDGVTVQGEHTEHTRSATPEQVELSNCPIGQVSVEHGRQLGTAERGEA